MRLAASASLRAAPTYAASRLPADGEFSHAFSGISEVGPHIAEIFRTNPTLKWIEPAYVTFSLDADGKVDRVTMKPVSPAADFSFDYQDLLFTPVQSSQPGE